MLTGVRLYIFCHRLGWGIKTCTSYPIVLLIRVRINESRLYITLLSLGMTECITDSIEFSIPDTTYSTHIVIVSDSATVSADLRILTSGI